MTSYETTLPNNGLSLESTTRDIYNLKEELNDTGAIVGGVIGGLVVCVVIGVLLVFLWKRRSAQKPPIPQTDNRDDDVTEAQIVSRPNAGYDNINSRYSLYQLERDDNGTPWNRAAETNVSDLYSKVNKTGRAANTSGDAAFSVGSAARTNHHGDYDRVQGEAAHFKVHGDYDHVVRHSYGESSSNDVIGAVTGNADVDMTYNQLHRGRAVPARTETEANPYDVLNRANTRAKQDLDA
ncbi:uncharacterized protein LOC135461687 [Liolophura sinensis]|uniref:uncharacterized protein LOC135461687 n=1 Tax=Liolophura sinensis TaxID=3198878 RepID=UPI003157FC32